MLYYAVPLSLFYAAFALARMAQLPPVVVVVGSLPAIALALLRGNVGVDTVMYLQSIETLRAADSSQEIFEPLFEQLILLLGRLPVSNEFILAVFALLTTVLLFRGWTRVEPRLIVFSSVFAQFYFDMTMNGVRYGLAFSLVVYALPSLLRSQRMRYAVLVGMASMIQLSGGMLGLLLYLLHESRWRALLYVLLGGAGVLSVAGEYLLLKAAANEVLERPTAASGLAPLVITLTMLLGWLGDRRARSGALLKIGVLCLLELLSYGVTQMFYAGLRFQLLVLFLSALVLAAHLHSRRLKLRPTTASVIVLAGLVGGLLRLRNFADGAYEGDTPFIPYHFFWDVR